MVSDRPKPSSVYHSYSALHVVGHQVDVVEPVDAGSVAKVVALVMVADPLDLVEVLDDEAERVEDPHRRADPAGGAGRVAAHLASTIGVEDGCGVEVVGRAHAEREPRACRHVAPAKDQAVVGELLVTAEVDGVGVLGTDDEAEAIDPEVLAGAEIGDDQFCVRRTNDVGGRRSGHRHDRRSRRRLASHGNIMEGGHMPARNGDQFLKGLRARNREVWLGDERVDDVTTHPQLEGAAHSLARVFDIQHEFADECLMPDPETGEAINISHMIPRSIDDLKRRHRGLRRIAESSVGLMGRTPDYMNVTFAGFAGERGRVARPRRQERARSRQPAQLPEDDRP